MDVFDAAERYRNEGRALIILAGRDYGSGECGIYIIIYPTYIL